MNDRTKAALIGGIIAGVLSGIPYIGGCCFLWALGGGFLAIYMIMKNNNAPMEMGEGAKIGAIAGAFALIPFVIIRVLFMLLGVGATAAFSPNGDNAALSAGIVAAAGIGGIVIGAVVVVVCAVLGGVIGVAALGKKGAAAPPPPPPPPAGGYGGPGM